MLIFGSRLSWLIKHHMHLSKFVNTVANVFHIKLDSYSETQLFISSKQLYFYIFFLDMDMLSHIYFMPLVNDDIFSSLFQVNRPIQHVQILLIWHIVYNASQTDSFTFPWTVQKYRIWFMQLIWARNLDHQISRTLCKVARSVEFQNPIDCPYWTNFVSHWAF